MIEDEGQDHLLDQPKHAQIFVPADLVEQQAFVRRHSRGLANARQRFGHERPAEVERGIFGHHVVELPGSPRRCREHARPGELMVHIVSPWNPMPSGKGQGVKGDHQRRHDARRDDGCRTHAKQRTRIEIHE
jgi:hypothetical protein